MELFRTIGKSIYNPAFYRSIQGGGLREAFRYYFSLAAVIALAVTVFFGIISVPTFSKLLSKETIAKVVSRYPKDLEIIVKGGVASSNAKEPYIITYESVADKYSEKAATDNKTSSQFKNFIVIDTKDGFSLEQFKNFDTEFLLAKDALVIKDNEKDRITIQDLRKFPDFTLNETVVAKWSAMLRPFLKLFVPSMLLGLFAGELALFAFDLLYFLIAAFIILLIAKIKGFKTNYAGAYAVALYAATLGNILQLVFNRLLDITTAPFLFSVILIIVCLVNLKKDSADAAAPAAPAAPTTASIA